MHEQESTCKVVVSVTTLYFDDWPGLVSVLMIMDEVAQMVWEEMMGGNRRQDMMQGHDDAY